jgi:hypothetical protein
MEHHDVAAANAILNPIGTLVGISAAITTGVAAAVNDHVYRYQLSGYRMPRYSRR